MSSFDCKCRCIKKYKRDRERECKRERECECKRKRESDCKRDCDHDCDRDHDEWIRQAIKEVYWRFYKTDAENAAGEIEIAKILKYMKNMKNIEYEENE